MYTSFSFSFVNINGLCNLHCIVFTLFVFISIVYLLTYTLSEAWSGMNWADPMAAQGAFGTDFYDRSTRTIVGTMLWMEYRVCMYLNIFRSMIMFEKVKN